MDSVIDHIKAEARQLQRAGQQREPAALSRTRKLSELRALPEDVLVLTLKRRHCLTVVARELGFRGWPHVLTVLQRPDAEDFGTLLYPPGCSAHWNVWCAAYDEARAIRSEHGGFLLPYSHQYVIVDQHFIETLASIPKRATGHSSGATGCVRSMPARGTVCASKRCVCVYETSVCAEHAACAARLERW